MSTATKETGTEYRCSCGRTFAHEISLKRHRWVTGHAEAEPTVEAAAAPAAETAAAPAATAAPSAAPAAPAMQVTSVPTVSPAASTFNAEVACQQAMQILLAKQQEQQAFDRQLASQARYAAVGDFIDWVGEEASNAAHAAADGARDVAQAGVRGMQLALQAALLLVILAGLLLTGISVGRIVANRADASTVSVVAPAPADASARQLVGAR